MSAIASTKKLLIETFSVSFDDGVNEAKEEKAKVTPLPDGRYRVRVKGQHCGIINRNGRRYVADKTWGPHTESNSSFMRKVVRRRMTGELKHPKSGESEMDLGAIVVTEVERPKPTGEVYVTFETMSTPHGQIVASYIRDKVGFGISSRAMGATVYVDGADEVQGPEDFEPKTFDCVLDESTPGAEVAPVMEAINKQRAMLVEAAGGDIRKAVQMAAQQTGEALDRDAPPVLPSRFSRFLLTSPGGGLQYRAEECAGQWRVCAVRHDRQRKNVGESGFATLADARAWAENHLRAALAAGVLRPRREGFNSAPGSMFAGGAPAAGSLPYEGHDMVVIPIGGGVDLAALGLAPEDVDLDVLAGLPSAPASGVNVYGTEITAPNRFGESKEPAAAPAPVAEASGYGSAAPLDDPEDLDHDLDWVAAPKFDVTYAEGKERQKMQQLESKPGAYFQTVPGAEGGTTALWFDKDDRIVEAWHFGSDGKMVNRLVTKARAEAMKEAAATSKTEPASKAKIPPAKDIQSGSPAKSEDEPQSPAKVPTGEAPGYKEGRTSPAAGSKTEPASKAKMPKDEAAAPAPAAQVPAASTPSASDGKAEEKKDAAKAAAPRTFDEVTRGKLRDAAKYIAENLQPDEIARLFKPALKKANVLAEDVAPHTCTPCSDVAHKTLQAEVTRLETDVKNAAALMEAITAAHAAQSIKLRTYEAIEKQPALAAHRDKLGACKTATEVDKLAESLMKQVPASGSVVESARTPNAPSGPIADAAPDKKITRVDESSKVDDTPGRTAEYRRRRDREVRGRLGGE